VNRFGTSSELVRLGSSHGEPVPVRFYEVFYEVEPNRFGSRTLEPNLPIPTDKPEIQKLLVEKNGRYYEDFPGYRPVHDKSPKYFVDDNALCVYNFPSIDLEYSDSDSFIEDVLNEDKEVEFYCAYKPSEQEKLMTKHLEEIDRPPKPVPFSMEERDNYGLRGDPNYYERNTSDQFFDELDYKYAYSFIFGTEDKWEAMMKEELRREAEIDSTTLPDLPSMEKIQEDFKQEAFLPDKHPEAQEPTPNLSPTIPEVECQVGLTKIVSACDEEKQEVNGICGDEFPVFDFTNDKVILDEYAERVAAENTANIVAYFSVKKEPRHNSEYETESEDDEEASQASEGTWYSSDYSYSSYDSMDEWIDADRNGHEPKSWTAERLKIYDSLEKARYEVNALEARLEKLKEQKRSIEDSMDSGPPSKKSRSEEKEEEEDDGEVFIAEMVNGRARFEVPRDRFAQMMETGFFEAYNPEEVFIEQGPFEDDEPPTHAPVVVPLADEDEYLLEQYIELLKKPDRHVHWADQVDNKSAGEEYAIYTTTTIDRPRNSALESWLIDSGATVHVTTTNEDMIDVKETSATVIVGDGKEVPATSRGTLLLATDDDQVIKLRDVLVVPHFTKHIISLPRLMQGNVNVTEWTGERVKLACPSGNRS
jgi:hypothetical protein